MLNNNNKAMENGYVVLPVEKYEELLNAVKDAEQAAECLIRLKIGYRGQVEVGLDANRLYTVAKKLYESSSFNTPERELIAPESFSAWTSDLTHEVTTKTEE